MEREIKFRAWLKEERKMVNVETLFIGINRLCFGNSETEDLFFRDFEEVELMQYTGLKDKNGKEVYEGDIVKIIELEGYGEYCDQVKYTGKIEYCVSEFRIQPLNLKLSDESIVEIEVIGNIYENKNLLEENNWLNMLKYTKSKLKMK